MPPRRPPRAARSPPQPRFSRPLSPQALPCPPWRSPVACGVSCVVGVDFAKAIGAARATADRGAIVSVLIFPKLFIFLSYSWLFEFLSGGPLLTSRLLRHRK